MFVEGRVESQIGRIYSLKLGLRDPRVQLIDHQPGHTILGVDLSQTNLISHPVPDKTIYITKQGQGDVTEEIVVMPNPNGLNANSPLNDFREELAKFYDTIIRFDAHDQLRPNPYEMTEGWDDRHTSQVRLRRTIIQAGTTIVVDL